MNEMDMEFYDEENESYPIYVFCTTGIGCNFPSLYGISSMWPHYMGFMQFNNRCMFELEVPESFILSMKPMTFRNKYKGEVFYKDYFNIILNKEKDAEYEGLIPYIKKENVVCIRTWEGCNYGNTLVSTRIVNENLHPLWIKQVMFNGDGYIRDLEGNIPNGINYNYILKELLPDNCADYYSYNFCEHNLLNINAIKKLRIELFDTEDLKEFYQYFKNSGIR